MKLLFLFLTFLSFIYPLSNAESQSGDPEIEFMDKVEKAYESYSIFKVEEQAEYSIIIIQGIFSNTGAYGIYFKSKEQGMYHVVLETVDSSFVLKESNGRYSAIAIKSDITYVIYIHDKNGKRLNTEEIVLQKFNKNDFDVTNASVGLGEGTQFATLNPNKETIPFLPVLLITMGSMIVIVLLTLFLLFVLKKGFFNKEKRQEGVISMRDIYESNTEALKDDIQFMDTNIDEENETLEEVTPKESTPIIPIINPNIRDDDDDAVSKITNIKEYLTDKGFITDYRTLSEDEKNKIMMELIKLKNDNLISMDDYYKETYELWKK